MKNNWICPKCLSANDKSTLECSCSLTIFEEDIEDFREDLTPAELFTEIDNYNFIFSERKASLLTYYLIKRFPDSDEARKLKSTFDDTSSGCIDKFFEVVDEERLKQEALKKSPLIICPDCCKSVSKRAKICPNCGCPISEVIATMPEVITPILPEPSTTPTIKETPSIVTVTNIPLCPTCGSSKIEKISLTRKVGVVALIGVFAIGKVAKTFKCNNCGHKW